MSETSKNIPIEAEVDIMLADVLGAEKYPIAVKRLWEELVGIKSEIRELRERGEWEQAARHYNAALLQLSAARFWSLGRSSLVHVVPRTLELRWKGPTHRLTSAYWLGNKKVEELGAELIRGWAAQTAEARLGRELSQKVKGRRLLRTSKVSKEALRQKEIVEKLRLENSALLEKVALLKGELRKNVPHLQLYRFGAGAFSLAVVSLLSWLVLGVAVPFHPLFAAVMIPTAIGFMVMGYVSKREAVERNDVGTGRAAS